MRKITIVILTIVMVVCLNGCSYFKNKNNLDNKFSVVLVDCYGLHYGKENVVIEKEGNTEIVITKED